MFGLAFNQHQELFWAGITLFRRSHQRRPCLSAAGSRSGNGAGNRAPLGADVLPVPHPSLHTVPAPAPLSRESPIPAPHQGRGEQSSSRWVSARNLLPPQQLLDGWVGGFSQSEGTFLEMMF